MGRNAKGVKEERRRQVANLYYLHNQKIPDIARTLDWDYDVIWADVKALKSEWDSNSKEDALNKAVNRYDRLIQEAAKQLELEKIPREKRAWMKELRETQKDYTDTLLRTGIIKEAPKETIQKTVDLNELFKQCIIVERPEDKNRQTTTIQDN